MEGGREGWRERRYGGRRERRYAGSRKDNESEQEINVDKVVKMC